MIIIMQMGPMTVMVSDVLLRLDARQLEQTSQAWQHAYDTLHLRVPEESSGLARAQPTIAIPPPPPPPPGVGGLVHTRGSRQSSPSFNVFNAFAGQDDVPVDSTS